MFKKSNIYALSVITVSILVLSGCGSDNDSNDNEVVMPEKTYVGRLVDAPIDGADYNCLGSSLHGVTHSGGLFECGVGEMVEFKIGNVVFGQARETGDHIVTPMDLAGVPRNAVNDPRVQKIASMFQSLDADGNPGNGISITPEVHEAVQKAVTNPVVLTDPGVSVEEVVNVAQTIVQTAAPAIPQMSVVPPEVAVTHVEATIQQLPQLIPPVPEGTEPPAVSPVKPPASTPPADSKPPVTGAS